MMMMMMMMMMMIRSEPMGGEQNSHPADAPRIGLHPSVSLRCATVHLAAHSKEELCCCRGAP